eukprot:scaffold189774_cov32-Tisochrysis_lutea.AAC.1
MRPPAPAARSFDPLLPDPACASTGLAPTPSPLGWSAPGGRQPPRLVAQLGWRARHPLLRPTNPEAPCSWPPTPQARSLTPGTAGPSRPGDRPGASAWQTKRRPLLVEMSSGSHSRTADSWLRQLRRSARTYGSACSSVTDTKRGGKPSAHKSAASGAHGKSTSSTILSSDMSTIAERRAPYVILSAFGGPLALAGCSQPQPRSTPHPLSPAAALSPLHTWTMRPGCKKRIE